MSAAATEGSSSGGGAGAAAAASGAGGVRPVPFVTCDVFTSSQFGGNQLAVCFDDPDSFATASSSVVGVDAAASSPAEWTPLTTEQMQRIALEFNYAETLFVRPLSADGYAGEEAEGAHASARIFTPASEMPFAGHPNIGAAMSLAREGKVLGTPLGPDVKEIVLQERAGRVRIALEREAATGRPLKAQLTAPQVFTRREQWSAADIAACVGLTAEDVDMSRHEPVTGSCGLPFVLTEVASREVLAKASPSAAEFRRVFGPDASDASTGGPVGIHLYVRCAGGDGERGSGSAGADTAVDIHARMFAPEHGVVEDAATGSANVALIGLQATLAGNEGQFDRVIGQGFDLGRPSILHASASVDASGTVTQTRIAGDAVPVMRGVFNLRA